MSVTILCEKALHFFWTISSADKLQLLKISSHNAKTVKKLRAHLLIKISLHVLLLSVSSPVVVLGDGEGDLTLIV